MAEQKIMSQTEIDALVQQANAALKGATDEKAKQEAVKNIVQKNKSYPYICAYCKTVIHVEYEKVNIAPMIFTHANDCNSDCGHWLLSESQLRSLKVG